jgi:hypothetical protein
MTQSEHMKLHLAEIQEIRRRNRGARNA